MDAYTLEYFKMVMGNCPVKCHVIKQILPFRDLVIHLKVEGSLGVNGLPGLP